MPTIFNFSPSAEPAKLTGLLVTCATAILMLVLFFFPAAVPYTEYIKTGIGIVAPLVAGWIIRRFVTPVPKAQAIARSSFEDGVTVGKTQAAVKIVTPARFHGDV